MKSYTHFTPDERICLQDLLKKGKSYRQIAEIMGRSPSTISRELKRNWSKKKKHYNAWEQMLNIFVAEKTATEKIIYYSTKKCINLLTKDYYSIGHLKSLRADGIQNILRNSRFHLSIEL